MSTGIIIALSQDEALVLCSLFDRFEFSGSLALMHNSEFIALSRISAQLDKALVEPFAANYETALNAARDRLANAVEGLLPGVSGREA